VSCGLRDVAEFEAAGRPAVLVASAAFERTAGEQARRLGAPGLARLFVPHPVQDRTDDELREMAAGVVDGFADAVIG
jgi:uncharacterized membrane protein